MRRGLVLLLGFLLAMSAFSTVVSASVPLPPRPWGVYTDIDTFNKAVETSPKHADNMGEVAKKQRREQVSKALSDATTQKQLEQVAARFGLIMLIPNDVRAMSDGSSLSYVTAPSMTWDSSIMEYEIAGTMQWRNPSDLQADAGCPCSASVLPKDVGKRDTISLVFSNWPASASVTSYYTAGYDWNNYQRWTTGVVDYFDYVAPKKTVSVSKQDQWLSDSSSGGFSNMWRVRISMWVKNWDTSVHGLAQTVYAHDWATTDITGADFSLTGGSDLKLAAGLVIHFTSSTDRWAVQGPDLSY